MLRSRSIRPTSLAIMILLIGCGGENQAPLPGSASTPGTAKRIGAVLPMFSHPFFLAQKAGLEAKAKELGVTIDVRDGQDDDLKQISQVEALLNSGIDLLILCPRDADALIPAVEAANRAKVPVVTLNRRVNGGDVVTYVGADDVQGGQVQGEALVAALGSQGGSIIYLQGTQGSSPQRKRQEGLLSVLKSHPEIKIADDRFAAFQEDRAKAVMTDLVQAHPAGSIRAVVAQADEMALPAAEVAKAEGWKDLVVIGLNGNSAAFAAVESGAIYATVLQDPTEQAVRAVEAAVDHLSGKAVAAEVITPLVAVTKANVKSLKPAY